MQVFDELKSRGVEDVFFISMDSASGLEEGAKAIFPSVIVQRCIVHLVRNALRYIPSKDYKEVCKDMKKFYGASSLNAAHAAFDSFQNGGPNILNALLKLLYLRTKELHTK